jgi:hypothetical protein
MAALAIFENGGTLPVSRFLIFEGFFSLRTKIHQNRAIHGRPTAFH